MSVLGTVGTVLFIVFFFGFCIFIHEFGHLLAAVWQGLHVDKFSIGFGRRLCGFRYRGIDFVVSLLPLGGYVSIPQLDPADQPKAADGRVLPFATPKARAITAVAGPLFNILFGFALAAVLWVAGVWQTPPTSSCVVTDVPVVVPVVGSEGIRPGERIVAVNGVDVTGLKLSAGTYEGGLYDLCVFWGEFPAECGLAGLKDGDRLPLTVKDTEGQRRAVEYPVALNREHEAGLRVGDRIVAFNGSGFRKGVNGLFEAHAYNEGPTVTLTVRREGRAEPLDITFEQLPNSRVEDLKVPFFQARDPITVSDVLPDSPAAAAGVRRGDQLLAVGDRPPLSVGALLADLRARPGATVPLLVARDGQERTLDLAVPAAAGDRPLSLRQLGLAFAVTVKTVFAGSPADLAGLRPYDRLYAIDGQEVTDGRAFSEAIRGLQGRPFTLTVIRDGKELDLPGLKAVVMDAQGRPAYLLGIQMDDETPKVLAHPNPWEQFEDVFNKTARTLWLLFQPITNFVTGRDGVSAVKLKHMSSFVGITAMLWYTVRTEGLRGGLAFIVLITFGLAFANLLPFPILDGGHVMFAGIEFLIRRRLPPKFMNYLSNAFAALLILLMVYITFNDIRRLPRINRAYSSEKPKLELKAAPATEPATTTAP